MKNIKKVEMALRMKRAAKKRKVYLTDEGKKILNRMVGVSK